MSKMKGNLNQLFPFILILLLSGRFMIGFGQNTPTITKPAVRMVNDKIKISYDIMNYSNDDRFNVWIDIKDSNGNSVIAKSLNGDVGNDIKGGINKMVIWDPDADRIELDTGIYIQVYAEVIKSTPEISEPSKIVFHKKKVKASNLILQSMALPGLGLTLATNGKPHWLRGLAGYGCIMTSIVLNRTAVSSFEKYKTTSDVRTRNELFNSSKMQDDLSEIFALTAAGIWVTDIVWTLVGSSKMNSSGLSQETGIRIGTRYEPMARAPILMISYSF